MDDLDIKEYQNRIVRAINSVELPLEVKRLILAEIYTNLINSLNAAIEKQIKERDAKLAEKVDSEIVEE